MIHQIGRKYQMGISNYHDSKKLKVYLNYKKVNDVTKMVLYPFLFCNEVFKSENIRTVLFCGWVY